MKKWLHKIEIVVDKLIPFLLFILILIIISEISFHDFMVKYHQVVQVLDWFIVVVFVLDLIFKYLRIRNFPKFLRASWIEIIAVFPFFLVFRFFEGFIGLFGGIEGVSQTQKIIHIGEGLEREVISAEEAARIGRAERLSRFLRPMARSIRLFKFESPVVRKETRKDIKGIKKEGKKVVKEIEEVPRHVKAALFYERPGVNVVSSKEKLIKDKKNRGYR